MTPTPSESLRRAPFSLAVMIVRLVRCPLEKRLGRRNRALGLPRSAPGSSVTTCQVITISGHHRIGWLTNSSLRCEHSVQCAENLLGGEVVSDSAFGSDYEPSS